jgi:dTDP-4-dehydrorhamnose reductase
MGRVGILGSTGMLGSVLTRHLTETIGQVVELNRSGTKLFPGNLTRKIDVTDPAIDLDFIFADLEVDYVINAIGLIRQLINKNDEKSVRLAEEINSQFPKKLNDFSIDSGVKVIQIGTDCVFSGSRGGYTESDAYNPIDLYGISKAKGEVNSTGAMTIRCSIIGREPRTKNSLLEWVLTQPANAEINGYSNHIWNGVTTLDFAKIVGGIVTNEAFRQGTFHLVPKNEISKSHLIRGIANEFGRNDLRISEFRTPTSVNLTLNTNHPTENSKMWTLGGYNGIPTIEDMIKSYARWSRSS